MKKIFWIIALIFLSTFAWSQKITQKDIKKVNYVLQKQLGFEIETSNYYLIDNNDTLAIIKNYKNGYAVVSYDKQFAPLKAFSNKPLVFGSESFDFFISLLKYDYRKQKEFNEKYPAQISQNKTLWDNWLNGNNAFKGDTIGPLLASKYGQVNCHDDHNNLVNVTNYYTPNHYAVGCVAMTFAETMRYYRWPIHGQGSHSYTDDQNSSTGTYSVDFGKTTYRWDLMQDEYDGVASTDETRQALGLLTFHAAVSVDMDFENGGSTSNINRIPNAASHYFRYDMPAYATTDDPDFWTMVDEALTNGNPVQFAVYTSSGAGHAIVCDGIIPTSDPQQQYYHLNMGWWGDSNGWYLIQSDFNAGGYSIIDAAVFQMIPVPELKDVDYDLEQNVATVSWYYSERIKNPVYELQRKDDTGEWKTVADNLTDSVYTFTPDIDVKYKFRVKTSENSNWSEEITFDPSIEASKLNEIQFSPTLAKDDVYIKYKNLKDAKIFIYSVSGNLVYYEDFGNYTATEKAIDLSFLQMGLYIANIVTTDNQKSFRFVFQ